MNPMDFTSLNWDEMPWYVGLAGMLITALLTFLTARITSKDKVQSDLVTQTVERQKQLDIRQNKMIDDFQEEINRLRDDLILVRSELNSERNRNSSLEADVKRLTLENIELKKEVSDLRTENTKLKSQLGGTNNG